MGRATRSRAAVGALVVLGLLVFAEPASANPLDDIWGWGTGLFSDAARGAAGDGIRALTSWVADGAGWLCRKCFEAMSATSDPRPDQGWFSDSYRRMTLIAATLSTPCLVLGVTQSILHQDARLLARVIAAVPGSVLLTFAAVAVTRMLLGATDQMSLWLVQTSGRDIGEFGLNLSKLLAASPGTSAFVVFLVAAVTAVCALVLWVELLVRAALVYVLLGFFPLMAAMMIWPAAAGGVRRLIRLLVAVILSKVVIVGVISMAAAGVSESGTEDRFEGLLVGTAMIGVACFAPMAIFRLLPLLEEAVHVRGNLSGGGAVRTGTSAMYSTDAVRSLSRQMTWARGGGAGGGDRPLAAAAAVRNTAVAAGGLPIAGGKK